MSATLTPALCVVCDAPRGKCDHRALCYTDPIAYNKVPGGFEIPPHELNRGDAGDALQASLRARDQAPKHDPSVCIDCGDHLSTFQVLNGFDRCSGCYRKA